MVILLFPLAVLGALAAYVAGLGIESAWNLQAGSRPPFHLEYAISAALHAAWLVPATRRTAAGLVAASWTVSVYFSHEGLTALGSNTYQLPYALVAETIPLLVALAFAPRSTWAERLARWRRARSEVGVQLRMSEGVISWFGPALRQLFVGAPALPPGMDYCRFAAELADAEHRLRSRLRGTVLPEQVRQTILACAADLVGQAETAAARTGFELEQAVVAAAARCRDQIEDIDSLSAEQKMSLARHCESLFLELIEPARQAVTPVALKKEREYEPAC